MAIISMVYLGKRSRLEVTGHLIIEYVCIKFNSGWESLSFTRSDVLGCVHIRGIKSNLLIARMFLYVEFCVISCLFIFILICTSRLSTVLWHYRMIHPSSTEPSLVGHCRH